MGIRFRKYINIIPGVRLNLSKSGISTTFGTRGLSMNTGKRGTYLNAGIPGTGIFSRTKLSGDSSVSANGVNHLNGSVASTDFASMTPRQKLQLIPLRNIAIFFVTLLLIGFMRSGELAAIWVIGWSSYILVKLAFAVKKKVDENKSK
jgi:hypothetical protein